MTAKILAGGYRRGLRIIIQVRLEGLRRSDLGRRRLGHQGRRRHRRHDRPTGIDCSARPSGVGSSVGSLRLGNGIGSNIGMGVGALRMGVFVISGVGDGASLS